MSHICVRDLQNFMLGGKRLLEESGQEVFEYMGKPRYYHQMHLENGINKVPANVKMYRLGSHEPGAEEFKIKTVKNEPKVKNAKKK